MVTSRLCEDHKQSVMNEPINRPVKKQEAVRATKSYGLDFSSMRVLRGGGRTRGSTGCAIADCEGDGLGASSESVWMPFDSEVINAAVEDVDHVSNLSSSGEGSVEEEEKERSEP